MDSQHYPNEPANEAAYLAAMSRVSVALGVPLFDRYVLMKTLIDSGRFSYADLLAADAFHPNDRLHRCMGQVLADLVVATTVR